MRGQCKTEQSLDQKAFILEQFPKHELDPLEWMNILATLNVCVNEVTPTKLCDEDGYDLVPIMIVNTICGGEQEEKETLEDQIDKYVEQTCSEILKESKQNPTKSLTDELQCLCI